MKNTISNIVLTSALAIGSSAAFADDFSVAVPAQTSSAVSVTNAVNPVTSIQDYVDAMNSQGSVSNDIADVRSTSGVYRAL